MKKRLLGLGCIMAMMAMLVTSIKCDMNYWENISNEDLVREVVLQDSNTSIYDVYEVNVEDSDILGDGRIVYETYRKDGTLTYMGGFNVDYEKEQICPYEF